MPSERKTQANRRNAQLSTGPKTSEGKAIVSRNAVRHGLASRLVVLPEENRQDFLDLLGAFRSQFQPATAFEDSLVFQLAAAEWRLRRITRLEAELGTGHVIANILGRPGRAANGDYVTCPQFGPPQPCPKNSPMTAAVRAMSSSLCAAETKAASNCEAGQ